MEFHDYFNYGLATFADSSCFNKCDGIEVQCPGQDSVLVGDHQYISHHSSLYLYNDYIAKKVWISHRIRDTESFCDCERH